MFPKKYAGFTLMEIILTVSIFCLLMGAIFLVFTTGRATWQIGNVRIGLQQELRRAMDWCMQELRQSSAAVISDVPADSLWYNTITFRLPAGVSEGNILWSAEQIQYLLGGLNGRQLLRQVAGEQRVLANDVTSFQLRRQVATPDIVEIALRAEKATIRGEIISLALNFQVKLRN